MCKLYKANIDETKRKKYSQREILASLSSTTYLRNNTNLKRKRKEKETKL